MEVIADTPAVHEPTPLARLSAASVSSRLHLAIVLVGWVRLPADAVLDLTWSDLDLSARTLRCDGQTVYLGERLVKLFDWHEARQRLDHLRVRRWADPGNVFVNRYGTRFTPEQANAALEQYCRLLGLPAVPLSGLRHPVMRG